MPSFFYNCYRVDGSKFFGKDADKILEICTSIMNETLRPTKPTHPARYNREKSVAELKAQYKNVKEYETDYAKNHPGEMKVYEDKYKTWYNNYIGLFKKLYNISKHHHIYIEWHGESKIACCPDRFTIYRYGKQIGIIECL